MDQIKIGKFISSLRKNKKMTQEELAEKLGVTNRAVSKWENGRGMPDSSIMLELCNILGINVNELLSGRKINMKEYNKEAEENLKILKEENEINTKKLFIIEIILIAVATIFLGVSFYLTTLDINKNIKIVICIISLISFLVTYIFSINVETKIGYYECPNCKHKHKPTYKESILAVHFGLNKKLKCPNCQKKIWHKKVYRNN